ncbi:hypothetical protein CLF_112788 [Clonorchis sinensis]|uniref:Uncharacterized protein n=1 Tax=Clonorchis sinensis TaxID=79923 RepID=G7YX00_CLOSI|nr:hypothetical protein CLF_112788 [Clonorchis sinensis]
MGTNSSVNITKLQFRTLNLPTVFREHQNKCLLKKEKASEQCTVVRNHTIREVVTALQNMSASVSAGSSEYYRSVQATLARYECRTIRSKLECLFNLLYTACPPDALRLIMNYFKETLPEGCTFHYENRLVNPLKLAKEPVNPVQHDPGAIEMNEKSVRVNLLAQKNTAGQERNCLSISCGLLMLQFIMPTHRFFR